MLQLSRDNGQSWAAMTREQADRYVGGRGLTRKIIVMLRRGAELRLVLGRNNEIKLRMK